MAAFDFLCGGVRAPSSTGREAIRLDIGGPGQNVNLRITDITRAMVSNIPDVLVDLLEIAAYVYCADQHASRGSDLLPEYGRDWRRQMNFVIPVRLPELWTSAEVKQALCVTLGFLSDDFYSFSFVPAVEPLSERERYFTDLVDGSFVPDDVVLFSGGLDSFAGVAKDMVGGGKRLSLVGHFSAPQVTSVQKQLVDGLKDAGLRRQLFHVPVNISNAGNHQPKEFTQRSRSFLFACLALVVARMFERDSFTFYENGVVSLNIPMAKDVIGARATRTTHPKAVRGFEQVFSAVLNRPIIIDTPFRWNTKREVVQLIGEHGLGHLVAKTVSCAHPRLWTQDMSHCGECSQCIDRRFAILAAGLEEHDPADRYGMDLLLGDRSYDPDLRLAIAYVGFFREFASLNKARFIAQYPEIASSLRSFGIPADEAATRIFDLYQRHASDVNAVLEAGSRRHLGELLRGEIPPGALLAMCFNRTTLEAPPEPGYDAGVKRFMDALSEPRCEFAVDDRKQRIVFKGDFALTGAHYKLINALLGNFRAGKTSGSEIAFFRPDKLADSLEIDQPSLRQQIGRLRRTVSERLSVDQGIHLGTDGFIENRPADGYRLNPTILELDLGDIENPSGAMSHA